MRYEILVVEDDADISRLLARILNEAGYKVRQAFSGTEARLVLEGGNPERTPPEFAGAGSFREELPGR